jgi:hypothetical protein
MRGQRRGWRRLRLLGVRLLDFSRGRGGGGGGGGGGGRGRSLLSAPAQDVIQRQRLEVAQMLRRGVTDVVLFCQINHRRQQWERLHHCKGGREARQRETGTVARPLVEQKSYVIIVSQPLEGRAEATPQPTPADAINDSLACRASPRPQRRSAREEVEDCSGKGQVRLSMEKCDQERKFTLLSHNCPCSSCCSKQRALALFTTRTHSSWSLVC